MRQRHLWMSDACVLMLIWISEPKIGLQVCTIAVTLGTTAGEGKSDGLSGGAREAVQ